MASPCELRLYATRQSNADQVAEMAIAEVFRIERSYSRYRDDSIVSKINAAAGVEPVEVHPEAAALLNYADTVFQESDGLFDITSGVLRRVWDFKSEKLPDPDALEAARQLIGWGDVQWRDPWIFLPKVGMQLDFGGFGKEWAVDAAVRICEEHGIAHGLVDLGGDLRAIGPHPDGSPWQVGIRDPRQPESAIAVLPLTQGGLASSGDYERFFILDGQRYCHILNPKMAWPISNSFASVSVIAPLCLLAGTGATVAMLKGQEEGEQWLQSLGLAYFWVDEQGGVGGSIDRGS